MYELNDIVEMEEDHPCGVNRLENSHGDRYQRCQCHRCKRLIM